jgi:hypothetical protein
VRVTLRQKSEAKSRQSDKPEAKPPQSDTPEAEAAQSHVPEDANLLTATAAIEPLPSRMISKARNGHGLLAPN